MHFDGLQAVGFMVWSTWISANDIHLSMCMVIPCILMGVSLLVPIGAESASRSTPSVLFV
jgi:hypothetical protein